MDQSPGNQVFYSKEHQEKNVLNAHFIKKRQTYKRGTLTGNPGRDTRETSGRKSQV